MSGKNTDRRYAARIKNLVLAICIVLMHTPVFAQSDSIQQKPPYDSAKHSLLNSFKQYGAEEERKNTIEYNEDTIATKQDEILEQIRGTTLEAKNYLSNALDTAGLGTELDEIENWYNVSRDGVFTNTGTTQTNRNLETSVD